MKKLFYLFLTLFLFAACASGPGSSEDSTGLAALSLQLPELAAGTNFRTQDEFTLEFTTFALAFSAMTMGSDAADEPFAADFFDEEVIDIIEIIDVPPGEYEDFTLTLAAADGLTGPSVLKFLGTKNAAVGGEVTSSLNGLSALVIANAISNDGSQTCTLRVELQGEGTISVANEEANHVEVTAGNEAEILIQVDPSEIFGNVDVAPVCTGGNIVVISSQENALLADAISGNLLNNPAFQLESTEGHSHSH